MRFGRRRRASGWLLGGVAVVGAGVAAARLADPRRRAGAVARARRALHDAEHLVDQGVRDLGRRAQGIAHETRARLTPERADDDVIAERVRARLGHLASHGRAIHVVVREGHVELSGPVFAAERTQVLRGVRALRGVRGLTDRLEPHDGADVAALRGAGPLRAPPGPLPPGSPGYRLVAGAAGAFLVGRALIGGGAARIPAGLVGASLIARVLGDAGEARRHAEALAREAHDLRAGARDARRWAGARGAARRTPEVQEVKSPSELEPGIASARPDPLRPGRVDRRDLRGRARPARGDDLGEEAEHDEQEHVRTEHAGFNAPQPGAGVRDEELGEMLPHEEEPAHDGR